MMLLDDIIKIPYAFKSMSTDIIRTCYIALFQHHCDAEWYVDRVVDLKKYL